ncbi:hypothetical protein DRO61_05100 [Candidatus Bathyarchaeota archaeon]|nr:MAG: hypothetical protein DRO61_05100 [Candidatus Bathyarchaeota archaeon]
MNILTDVAIYGVGFGFGWVTSRLFSGGFFRDSDSEDEEFDLEDSTSSEEESHDTPPESTSPTLVGASKFRRSRRCKRLRRFHRRQRQHKFILARKGLIEAINRNTQTLNGVNLSPESIKSLESAIVSLNETLKNGGLVKPSIENNCDPIEDRPDKVESPKGPSVGVLFPPTSRVFTPAYYGSSRGIQDESASMHIYDANFKAPKCEDTWSLNTPHGQDPYDYRKHKNPSTQDKKKEVPSTSPEDASTTRDELRDMFQDCKKGNPKKEPTLLTKPGGGYATMGDLNQAKKEVVLKDMEKSRRPKTNPKNRAKNVLSRADELDVINSFSFIKGLGWGEAKNLAQEQGYSLHSTYINETPNYASEYSKSVLGVRVKDTNFDPRLGSDAKGLSEEATILSVVDVGGNDYYRRGLSTM